MILNLLFFWMNSDCINRSLYDFKSNTFQTKALDALCLKCVQGLSLQVSDFSFFFYKEQDHKTMALWSVLVEISGIEPLTS